MSNTPSRTISEAQMKLLAEIFRIIVKEITCDEDKERLAPGELGIDYTEGAFYIKNPYTGELFSPNSIEHVRQILSKFDPVTGLLNADRVSHMRIYTSLGQLEQIGISMSIDTVIRQMEYPSMLIAPVHYENYTVLRYPSDDGTLLIYKLSPESVISSYYDNNSFSVYSGRYNPYNQYFEGWVIDGSVDTEYLETEGGGDRTTITDSSASGSPTDLMTVTVRIMETLNAGATISYNGGQYLPILDSDGNVWPSAIAANNIIMLIYDEQRQGWLLVQSTESSVTAIIEVATDRLAALEKELAYAKSDYAEKINQLKEYVDSKVTELKQRPGNIVTKVSTYTAVIGNVDYIGAVADFVPGVDKLIVNYGQTVLRHGIDYVIKDGGVSFLTIRLAEGDVVQFIVIKQSTN